MCSSGALRCSQVGPVLVSLHGVFVKALVVEAGHGWLDVVSLSHVEILSKVLVSAPPVRVDH